MPHLRFDAALRTIGDRTIVRLPEQISRQLPSRGQVAVRGTINGTVFQTVLEPDGDFGHWLTVDAEKRQSAALTPGATASFVMEPTKNWPEPIVPHDLATALAAAPPKVQELWSAITPMARWEWVRWINATRNSATRSRRVEVGLSKLEGGKRRPCCFNLAGCTDPDLSKNGKLIDQA